MFVVLELLDQLLDLVLSCCILLLDCRKRSTRYPAIHGAFCKFSRNFSNRSMVPKMILRLGFVDLVAHIASSILARHVALSELSKPSGRAHPVFSHIPHSRCKLQVVCCRERLHVTVFGKTAGLSLEQGLICTKILYYESVSKYSCMSRSCATV